MLPQITWETAGGMTDIAKVHGGWLIKVVEPVTHIDDRGSITSGQDYRLVMTFVPDPNHEWEMEILIGA